LLKPQPTKGKEPKGEPLLDSVRVFLSSEDDIFLSMVSKYSNVYAVWAAAASRLWKQRTSWIFISKIFLKVW